MKKQTEGIIIRLCIIVGVCLIVGGIFVLGLWQWTIRVSEQRVVAYVDTLRTLMPEPQGAVPEERRDNTMSTVSLDGADFIGIIEMPRYGSALPVCADWGRLTKYPCCLSGSVYNSTIQIGGTSQKGQYDFYGEIFVGDTLFFTDMEGNRYTYKVTDLRYENHADQDALNKKESALTLFIKTVYSFEYLIVYCNIAE